MDYTKYRLQNRFVSRLFETGATLSVDDNGLAVILPEHLSRTQIAQAMEVVGAMAYDGYGADHQYKETRSGAIIIYISPD